MLGLVAGCDLYLPHGPEDDVCESPNFIASQDLRDPATGACQTFSTSGACECSETCDPVAFPNWGACETACDGLDQTSCEAESGCLAAFLVPDTDTQSGVVLAPVFRGCWATPVPPLEGGACEGLTADVCTQHDDCSAVYLGTTTSAKYSGCIAEPSCGTATCGPDQHCQPPCDACDGLPQCVPNQACDTLTTEGDCTLRADCVPVYTGTDCTCTPSDCTCASETYERCESAPAP